MTDSRTAAHLGIPLREYDARIVTFLEHYDEMLGEAAEAVRSLELHEPLLVDLGIGTAALAARCISASSGGSVIGIDSDPTMLELARARLAATAGVRGVELRCASYLEETLPSCDVAVASFSLHHVADPEAKRNFYDRCRAAVRLEGGLVMADCYLPASEVLVESGMRRWLDHLQTTYAPEEARAYMQAWAREDTYQPLASELEWLAAAGFRADVVWRSDLFAVLLCV